MDALRWLDLERRRDPVVIDRFFEEKQAAALACASRHQMLRPLKDEIPPEVGEADDVGKSVALALGVQHAPVELQKPCLGTSIAAAFPVLVMYSATIRRAAAAPVPSRAIATIEPPKPPPVRRAT